VGNKSRKLPSSTWLRMNKEIAMKNKLALKQNLGPFLTLLLWSVGRSDDRADTSVCGGSNPMVAASPLSKDIQLPTKLVAFVSLVLWSLGSSISEPAGAHVQFPPSRYLQPQSSRYWFRSEVHTP